MDRSENQPKCLTVKEYAKKYQLSISSVYKLIDSNRVRAFKTDNGWLVQDKAPPLRHSLRYDICVDRLSDYDLTLLWLNGTIMEEGTLVVRNVDPAIPEYLASVLGYRCAKRNNQTILKISSTTLCSELRAMGFTGRQDAELPPPPAKPDEFAAAFTESRCSYAKQLRYNRRHPGNKSYAYYVPRLSFCASYPVLQKYADALCAMGITPPRKLSPAANHSSAVLAFTSLQQMEAMQRALEPIGKNKGFWERFNSEIHQAPVPYCTVHGKINAAALSY